MKNKKIIALALLAVMVITGCSEKNINQTEDTTAETSSSILISETTESELIGDEALSAPVSNDGDGSQYISTADFSQADAGQAAGYIPKKPEDFEDPILNQYAAKLYNKGYSLIDMDYMGRIMAGFGLIPNTSEYFNTGVDAELVEDRGENGEAILEVCVIKMTEQQYTDIMLPNCEIDYYFEETYAGGSMPDETDDGVIRRLESRNGNYIEYHRDEGVCIVSVDHSHINSTGTYYDD